MIRNDIEQEFEEWFEKNSKPLEGTATAAIWANFVVTNKEGVKKVFCEATDNKRRKALIQLKDSFAGWR